MLGLCAIMASLFTVAIKSNPVVEARADATDPNFTLTVLPKDLDTDGYAPRNWYKIYVEAVNDSDPTYKYPVVLYTEDLRTDWYHQDKVIHFYGNNEYVYCFTDLGHINSITRTTGALPDLDYQADFNVHLGSKTYFDPSEEQESQNYFILDNAGIDYPANNCYADSIVIKFTLNTVNFSANGGSGTTNSQLYGYVGYVKNSSFTRDGYAFKCWNTKEDGKGTDYYYGDEIPASLNNQTLYAKWIPSSWAYSGTIPIVVSNDEEGDEFIENCDWLNIGICLYGNNDEDRAWTNVRPIENNRKFVLEYNDIPFEPKGYCVIATEENELYHRHTPETAANKITIVTYWTYDSIFMSEPTNFNPRGIVRIIDFYDGAEKTLILEDNGEEVFSVYDLYGNSGYPITSLNNVQLDENQNFVFTQTHALAANQQFYVVDFRDLDIKFINYSTEGLDEYFDTYYDNIRCLTAGTYKFIFDATTKSLLIKADFVDEAYRFAIYFNDTVTCTGEGEINHGDVALSVFWNNVASEFTTLSKDAKAYLKDHNASIQGDEIQTSLYRYDYIVFYKQYDGCTNFMNRTNNFASSNINNALGEDSSQLTIILVSLLFTQISLISVLIIIKRKRAR